MTKLATATSLSWLCKIPFLQMIFFINEIMVLIKVYFAYSISKDLFKV
jgi:hypothetical protein